MQKFDIAIIGGGASGLMCANCLSHSFSVAIVDANPLGKKLLATGNGRCNFTNVNISVDKYNTSMVKKYIKVFDNKNTINFFEKIGIPSFSDEEGRVYPLSESAKDIQSALIRNINAVHIPQNATKITRKNDFEINLSNGEKIWAKKVIIACGNKGLRELLSDFNLPIEREETMLCGFKVQSFDKNLFGLRENAVVRVKPLDFEERGQIQFRKDGISGIVIFNLSAKLANRIKYPFEIVCELLPDISEKQLTILLKDRCARCENLYVKDCLLGILKLEMAKYILKASKVINLERKLSQLTDKEIDEIVKNIKHLKLLCKEKYDDGQVLSGGIKLENLRDLESKVKGLYFCGETTNVYGVCGGYNLQWAWSSGYFLANKLNKDIEVKKAGL